VREGVQTGGSLLDLFCAMDTTRQGALSGPEFQKGLAKKLEIRLSAFETRLLMQQMGCASKVDFSSFFQAFEPYSKPPSVQKFQQSFTIAGVNEDAVRWMD
jgi:Ca2+-binding EF-hand superfamily protein